MCFNLSFSYAEVSSMCCNMACTSSVQLQRPPLMNHCRLFECGTRPITTGSGVQLTNGSSSSALARTVQHGVNVREGRPLVLSDLDARGCPCFELALLDCSATRGWHHVFMFYVATSVCR